MLVEIDEVVFPRDKWRAAIAGDKDAKQWIADLLKGLHLSMHALTIPPEWGEVVVKTLRQLDDLDLVQGVVINPESQTEGESRR